MAYCLYCGSSLSSDLDQTTTGTKRVGRTCFKCGKSDQLNNQFCVHCGSKMQSPGEVDESVARFTRELRYLKDEPSKPKHQPLAKADYRRPLNLVPFACLLGIAVGCLIGFKLPDLGFTSFSLQPNWPKQGLVIYANPPFAQVMIEDAACRKFSIGQLGPTGSLSLNDLPPGRYKVQIQAPGYQTVVQFASIEPDRPTVLGFPQKIDLPLVSSQ